MPPDSITSDNAPRWDADLEGAAREIAETTQSPLRVLAGPGTGKTFALMRRVLRLLQEGVTPSRILVCTFTRTAARDLQKELSGVQGAEEVRATTLHSLCFSILAGEGVLAITQRVPRPVMTFEERFLIEDLKNMSTFGGVRECDKRLEAFAAAWARLQHEEPGWAVDPTDRAFQSALQSWLMFHKAMHIGEVVPETMRFLKNNPTSTHRRSFDHILVDEYQDLNKAEQELVELLGESIALTIIGDEDQSIYSFKHAHPEGITNFADRHSTTFDVTLSECRRCPKLVVAMASALIGSNTTRAQRQLLPKEGNPDGEVHIVQWTTMEEEAEGLGKIIKSKIEHGDCEKGKVLVLSPSKPIGYKIRDSLRALGIDAHSFFQEEALDGNPKETDKCQSQEAFTLLALLANPEDAIALRCWCGFGEDSLQSTNWINTVRSACERSGEKPCDYIQKLLDGTVAVSGTRKLVQRYQLLQEKVAALRETKGQELVDALFSPSEEWAKGVRGLMQTITIEPEWEARQLYKALVPAISQPELPLQADFVRVMSLHKSKGLTADLVIIAGCVDGLLPRRADGATPEETLRQMEEQRRLFYVGLTRPKKSLILSSFTEIPNKLVYSMGVSIQPRRDRKISSTIASPFLSELGRALPTPMTGARLLAIEQART